MGYDLRIERKKDYEDYDEESNISLEEWLAYVALDKELELHPDTNSPGFCNWLAHPVHKGDDSPWFNYWPGVIMTKNPDKEIIKKMLRIAEHFKAKVTGDDGEFYDEQTLDEIFSGSMQVRTAHDHKKTKPWWKFW